MNRTVSVAVGGAIVGALIVLVYNAVLAPMMRAAPPPPPPPCTGAQCQVDVDVSGTPPTISVVPYTLVLSGGNTRGIIWHLRNNSYEFKDDCVQFKDANSANEFSEIGGNGDVCKARDKNSANPPTPQGAWGYQIKVYDKSSGSWLAVDPWIKNG